MGMMVQPSHARRELHRIPSRRHC